MMKLGNVLFIDQNL